MQSAYSKKQKDRLRRYSQGRQRPLARTIRQTVAEFFRQLVIFLFNQVGVGCLLLGYTVSGAFVFRYTEGEYSRALAAEVEQHREEAVQDLWEVTYQLNQFNRTEQQWWAEVTNLTDRYQRQMVRFVRRGYLAAGGGAEIRGVWTVPSSIIYCISIYSTIGYGYLTPQTALGKVSTIVYAIIGIPLMLLYMSNVGAVLANFFKFVYFKMCRRSRPVRGILLPAQDGPPVDLPEIVVGGPLSDSETQDESSEPATVPVGGCVLVMAGYILAGGILFGQWENWSYLDGSWFCYISLVSIGFGDLVPGFSVRETSTSVVNWKLTICAVYLLLGMSLIAMCFSLMQEDAIGRLKKFVVRIGCMRSKTEQIAESSAASDD